MTIQALYIHIPFCASRCTYCNFPTSACSDDAIMDAYTNALIRQLRSASHAGLLSALKTIYIGGGTPTHLGLRRLSSLAYAISLFVDLSKLEEFTLEANPESLTAQMIKDLFALGVDRFSLGVQSFDDAQLIEYGRIHTAKKAACCIRELSSRCDNISIDLICGLASQSMNSWKNSLHTACALGVKHISIYPLTLERGTLLYKRQQKGEHIIASQDTQADMMTCAEHILSRAGMHRYEVASYAYPGYEAKHNKAYWTGAHYLGLGCSASSCLGPEDFLSCLKAHLFSFKNAREQDLPSYAYRVRFSNANDVASFCKTALTSAEECEYLDKRKALLEDLMLSFRLSCGPDYEFVERVKKEEPKLSEVLEQLIRCKLIEYKNKHYKPTETGWLCGNEIFREIWALA